MILSKKFNILLFFVFLNQIFLILRIKVIQSPLILATSFLSFYHKQIFFFEKKAYNHGGCLSENNYK